MKNLILNTDSYKTSHFAQYPQGTQFVSSYIESRGGAYPATLFFGLQIFLKEYLSQPITHADIDEAEAMFLAHGEPFHRRGWEHILKHHRGYLPLEIEAVAEGAVVPVSNVLVQVRNTDPHAYWLTSYIETALLRAIWYPTTVATVSYQCKQIIRRYLEQTADDLSGLPFKLHDFGARGASSEETAAIGGAAHLVNFMGTDTVSGVLAAKRYYNEAMAGFSIPAAEHSTITAWGREGELAAYENMLNQFSGKGKLVAVVSDSYDLWHAIDNLWGHQLIERVKNTGGTLVIRPDSGNPVDAVVGTLTRLTNKFGYRLNSKGYKLLPDCVRVIQGDGISVSTIENILEAMNANGFSADNVAFGMGGELLQKVNRDTFKFAMKASAININGQWKDINKAPVTDPGKTSKRGRLALVKDAHTEYSTIRLVERQAQSNALVPVFRNGEILNAWSFQDVRDRAQNR